MGSYDASDREKPQPTIVWGLSRWVVVAWLSAPVWRCSMDATKPLPPTNSLTWVEQANVTLGWLAGTVNLWDGGGSEGAVALGLFRELQDWLGGTSNQNARSTYYRRGFGLDSGAASVLYDGIGGASGTAMVSVRQSAFEEVGSEALALFDWVTRRLARVSRVDLAGDDSIPHRTPAQLYALLPAARSRSRLASRELTQRANGESKLVVGARASPRYLRCYVSLDRAGVVRHELELKAAVAMSASARIRAGETLRDVWWSEYVRLVEWPES